MYTDYSCCRRFCEVKGNRMEHHAQETEQVQQYSDSTLDLQRAFLVAAMGLSSLLFGSKVSPDDFTNTVKKPTGLWLSILASVILAPLTAYILALILQLNSSDGIVLLTISCCPAGTLAPIFTYYTHSDVPLCLCVIVLTVLMSVGMIPLGIYLSSSAYSDLDLTHIPNANVVISLVVTMGSISIGMAFRNYCKKWADRFVMVLHWTPIAVTIVIIVIVGITIPHSIHTSTKEVFAVLLYLVIILSGTYCLGLLAGQTHKTCRAMAFCSASKSILLTLTMIHASFTGEVLLEELPIPTQFLMQYILIGILLSVIYKIYLIYAPDADMD